MAYQSSLPTRNADGSAVVLPSRTDPYNAAYVRGFDPRAAADEGSYFTTYNVTDGTGIAGHAAPVQADLSLKPLLHLFNGNSAKSVVVDFVRLRVTAVGAGATTTDFTMWVDKNGATTRTGTGTLATPVNVSPYNAQAAAAVVYFGPVVATAGTGEVRIDHQRVRSVVPVVEDQYVFVFGASNYGLPAAQALTGTNVVSAFVPCPPVVVGPLGNFKLQMWGASQSGAHSLEYTIGWYER